MHYGNAPYEFSNTLLELSYWSNYVVRSKYTPMHYSKAPCYFSNTLLALSYRVKMKNDHPLIMTFPSLAQCSSDVATTV